MIAKLIQFLDRLFPPTLERVLSTFETTKLRLEALAVRQVRQARNLSARAANLRLQAAQVTEKSDDAMELATRADRIVLRLDDFTV